jgi:hypothetical protein
MTQKIVAVLAAALLGGAVFAQGAKDPSGALEQRVERIEQAISRLESKLNGRQSGGGMMEGCRDMMGGGMMGRGEPNEQWRSPERKR